MRAIDLTPFGFTPTESLTYAALLQLGTATGYAVARGARLARANAYSALEGLVHQGAATRLEGRPARYRPTDPDALLARLAARQGEALDRLARSLAHAAHHAEPVTHEVAGSRAVANLIMHLVARAEGSVRGVIAADLWRPTLPAWRRAAARAALDVRIAGSAAGIDEESLVRGTVPAETPTALVVDDTRAVLAQAAAAEPAEPVGLWSAHPLIVRMVGAFLEGLA